MSSNSCGSVRLVLGSAVAVHTGLTGTFTLGGVESTIPSSDGTTVTRKSDVACGGCRAGSRVAGDVELWS